MLDSRIVYTAGRWELTIQFSCQARKVKGCEFNCFIMFGLIEMLPWIISEILRFSEDEQVSYYKNLHFLNLCAQDLS